MEVDGSSDFSFSVQWFLGPSHVNFQGVHSLSHPHIFEVANQHKAADDAQPRLSVDGWPVVLIGNKKWVQKTSINSTTSIFEV